MKLTEIANKLQGVLSSDSEAIITGVASLATAGDGEISFLTDPSYSSLAAETKATAVIVGRENNLDSAAILLYVDDVDKAMEELLLIFAPILKRPGVLRHPSAIIDSTAQLGANVVIGANAVIEAGVSIGDNSIIGAGCVIGRDVIIGADCRLWPNAVINHNCRLGAGVILHANSTIGTDGFGYRLVDGKYQRIPHIGNVVIEDDVEIGANSTVDRAKIGSTVIGAGSKVDNLVMIAHNVQVGKNCIIVSQTGIAGSSELGDYVVLAGQCGISDHVKIGAQAQLGPRAGVFKGGQIDPQAKVMGTPAQDMRAYFRELSLKRKLSETVKDVKELKKKFLQDK